MNTQAITIDGFRFIDHLHTTARQLPVLTQLISFLDDKQVHKRILEQLMTDWSNQEELINDKYRFSKGKITNRNKKTIALRYHLEVSPKLGLTTRYNDLYMNTKLSKIFLFLFENAKEEERNIIENCFYTFQLLILDGDGLLLSLNQLHNFHGRSQSNLQGAFREALNNRLLSKRELAPNSVKMLLSEKFRSINFIWKKPVKYAEHIIAPRYEWLSYLGLVKIERLSRTTLYSLTKKGKLFYHNIPTIISNDELKDIDDKWINENYFSFFDKLDDVKRRSFSGMVTEKRDQELGTSLLKALNVAQSSMSFKLPIRETLFFVSVDMFANRHIVINFSDILERLRNTFAFSNRIFLLKESGRPNEGYITITIKK